MPSTGLGIEFGWTNSAGAPIFAIHHADAKISSSLALICQELMAYRDLGAFLVQLQLTPEGAKAMKVG